MEQKNAIIALNALAHLTRLDAFRLLVKHEPHGIAAGDLARILAIPPNTLSNHLKIMTNADLVSPMRNGRSIVYRANLPSFHPLVRFLLQECCLNHPEACKLVETLALPSSPPKKKRPHARSRI